MPRRIGFVGLIIENREGVEAVNRVLSEHADIIMGRMGLPCREKGISVITLVVEATTDELGALSGKLGNIAGVSVKSSLAKERKTGGAE